MKITLAQIKYRTADFDFNYNQIISAAEKCDTDLLIVPQAGLEDIGGKDLVYDERCNDAQSQMYEKIAQKNFPSAILIGDVLINNGEISLSIDGFYEIEGKKVFVADFFNSEVECDLYVLAKNHYYTMNSYKEFVSSIDNKTDFVYVSAVGLADANVYAGGSFAKNKDGRLTVQMPLCKTEIKEVAFSKPMDFEDVVTEQQVFEVITFALKEYCACTGLSKVLLGLSGGIDSALTAVLAVEALGADNVLGIMMPSMFSSEGSITDSIELARNLGIQTLKEPITPMFDEFMKNKERKHDLAEENLQARLRGLTLMFYSNRENRLLLSTGNKSESAMGFGTLYGDLAGGYNLICDLTKTNVYKLSNYINRNHEIIPQSIIDKAPSAELHPNQKDQDRLPEYAMLDDIIEMYFEQNIPQEEIYKKYDKSVVDEVIKKTYRMQYKRYQCCLGVRLTERSFLGGIDLPIIQKMY